MKYLFKNNLEKKINDNFLKKGFLIFDIKRKKNLNYLKKKTKLELDKILKNKTRLENIHKFINSKDLNNQRMKIYNNLNSDKKFIHNYFMTAQNELENICGNELAMQRKVSLSIQMPNDDGSLLPMHSDVWSGCSPFEVVLWIPLVDCKKTNSIFFLPKKKSMIIQKKFKNLKDLDQIESKYKKDIKFLEIKYGQGLIFSHQLLHGNVINKESTSRWSFNCRFKSVFSPYHEKTLGETFSPIYLRPASQLGLKFDDN